jgi:hypothetical protein
LSPDTLMKRVLAYRIDPYRAAIAASDTLLASEAQLNRLRLAQEGFLARTDSLARVTAVAILAKNP